MVTVTVADTVTDTYTVASTVTVTIAVRVTDTIGVIVTFQVTVGVRVTVTFKVAVTVNKMLANARLQASQWQSSNLSNHTNDDYGQLSLNTRSAIKALANSSIIRIRKIVMKNI